MGSTTVAQVTENICIDSTKPLYPPIEVGSSFWFTWVKEPDTKSFHFESEAGKFTARKEERPTSTNEYWYAYRKVKGKLRKVYLGAGDELTGERLSQVAAEISQSAQDYYYSRKSYTASLEQKPTATAGDPSLTLEANGYPTKETTNCVTVSSELEALRYEVEQLRSQLLIAAQESRELRLEQQQTDEALSGLLTRIDEKEKGYTANSFTKGIKEVRSLVEKRGLTL